MKKHETTKLFWGQYLYKLCIQNRIGTVFRGKNLSHANQILGSIQQAYEAGEPLKIERWRRQDPVKESHFLDAKVIHQFLSKNNDYMLRVESNKTCIYSNNRDWIFSLKSSLHQENLVEFWEPDPDYIQNLETNIILVDKPSPYQYKVTLGTGNSTTYGFANWSKKNPKQVKVGPVLLEQLEKDGYVNGMYFYARDERTLQLCSLMLNCIRRIDKIITKQSLDK